MNKDLESAQAMGEQERLIRWLKEDIERLKAEVDRYKTALEEIAVYSGCASTLPYLQKHVAQIIEGVLGMPKEPVFITILGGRIGCRGCGRPPNGAGGCKVCRGPQWGEERRCSRCGGDHRPELSCQERIVR